MCEFKFFDQEFLNKNFLKDFDIAGPGELMMQEAECLKIADEVISKLELGEFEIRVLINLFFY